MSDVTFVVPRRSTDEFTIAIVKAELTPAGLEAGLDKERVFLEHLTRAVTKWVKGTEDGAAVWCASTYDLNIGDLAAYGDLIPIATLMERIEQGVLHVPFVDRLEVETYSYGDFGEWTFDTVLVDETELEDDEDA